MPRRKQTLTSQLSNLIVVAMAEDVEGVERERRRESQMQLG